MKLLSFLLLATFLPATERPNIVWIISDDLGPELGCYGYPDVATPHLDKLARQGARYTRAFSTSPVCSASRTAFQTGRYQTTVGGHHHDCRDKPVLPESIPTITGLMQKAGYFVSNGRGFEKAGPRLAKSHLNFVYDKKTFFDGHDWTQRAEGQPFFAQIQISEPHRGFHLAQKSYPESPIPPYYPEHPVTRADWDNYLASVEVMDTRVGGIMKRLEDEQLLDNTLVLFFGDHGRPHVRGKQWLYDGGIHTPLIAFWKGRIQPGTLHTNLASLLDAMPTTLAAAKLEVPTTLEGLNLLAPAWKGHPQVFAARDRCGDALDRIRSVRTKDYKYIRNFHPERPYLQESSYKLLNYPVQTVMKALHAEGKWDSLLMAKTRPPEELYHLPSDPHEMNNLADQPEHAQILKSLRATLNNWILETKDLGAIDESLTVDIDAMMAEKKKWYRKTMESRDLASEISPKDYLAWWTRELVPQN